MIPRILIVDDDIQVLKIMSQYLKDIAHVDTVTGGKQALDFVTTHNIDIILLDVEMPILDGFLTLELLREVESCINVPVIMVTGKQDKHTIFNSCLKGVDGYLVKPVAKNTLIQKINEVYKKQTTVIDKKTIMLIDDDMSYLKQLNNMLQGIYNVVMINSAKLALNYLSKHTPDLIVLDYQMPLFSGAEVMNMIKQNENNADIPIIILSGALDMSAFNDCYIHKPADCLAKPVSKETLLSSIQKALK